MTTTTGTPAVEGEIRELISRYTEAIRGGDPDAIAAHYDPAVVAFDAIGALRIEGRDAYREHWRACLSHMNGPMTFEAHGLHLHTAGDLAFGHYLCRCGCRDQQGEEHSGWLRASFGARRSSDGWRLVHEHYSAPFDPESGRALLELQP